MLRLLRRLYYYLRYGPEHSSELAELSGAELATRIRTLEIARPDHQKLGLIGGELADLIMRREDEHEAFSQAAVQRITQKNRLLAQWKDLEEAIAELELVEPVRPQEREQWVRHVHKLRARLSELEPALVAAVAEVETLERQAREADQRYREACGRAFYEMNQRLAENGQEIVSDRIKQLDAALSAANPRFETNQIVAWKAECALLHEFLKRYGES